MGGRLTVDVLLVGEDSTIPCRAARGVGRRPGVVARKLR
ncbi:hypothetical protein Ae505Ps2_0248c [Pseudonocardia sp. Ae505_Ps2]|nr:hypothetical protein Ae505Ps2_0248c [Pseudonocardia sp. Ae505_Ps2]